MHINDFNIFNVVIKLIVIKWPDFKAIRGLIIYYKNKVL